MLAPDSLHVLDELVEVELLRLLFEAVEQELFASLVDLRSELEALADVRRRLTNDDPAWLCRLCVLSPLAARRGAADDVWQRH